MANPLTTWRGEPGSGFDIQQALAAIRARPDLSGFGGPHIEGSGENAMMYDSLPFSATGSYFNSGYAITPNEDGTYLVYRPAEGGNASKLNGTLADKYDASGNYLGKEELKGISDASTLKDLATFAALAAGAGYGASALAGAGGAGAGAGGGWMSGVSGEAIAGAGMSGQGLAGGALGAGGATGFNFAPSLLPEATTLTGGQSLMSGLPAVTEASMFNPGAWSGWGAIPEGMGYGLGATAGASFLPALEGVPPPPLGPEGMPPPANPGSPGNPLSNILGPASSLLGPAATLAGAALGGKGNEQSASTTRDLPGFLQGPVTDLTQRTQGLLNTQMPEAQATGGQMVSRGMGLLNAPVAGNGFGQIKLNAPNTPTNPYATGILDDLQRRSGQLIGQNLQGIKGNAVGVGGLGGSRQGVAEAQAIAQGQDNFLGQASNFMGSLYNQDQNRALSQYGMDQGFYGQQRGQDLAQVGVGGGLVSQGMEAQWSPLRNAASVYSPFTGNGTTTQSQQTGGGWGGALGGALGGAQLGKNMGWW